MERDLTLGVKVVGAPAAKAEIDALKQSTDSLSTENAEVAASATAAAAATTEQAAASRLAGAAATQQAAQQSTVVLALREARAAFAENTAAVIAGGAGQATAITAIAGALGKVIIEMEAVRATGGVVTPAQQLALDGYILRLRELAVAGGLVTGEFAKTGAAASASVGALTGVGAAAAATAAQKRLLTTATAQAGNAMAGSAVSAGGLTASFLRILGPIGLVGTAIALLPTALNAADEGSKRLGKAIDDLRHGIDDEAFAVQKAGESMEDYEARVTRARDTREAMLRGFIAMGAGLIKESTDLNVAAAAWEVYNATKHKSIEGNDAFARSAKALGISLIEGFGAADVKVQAFFRIYDEYLGTRGPAVAQRFAAENKKSLDLWIRAFEEAGQTIPSRLRLIMEGLAALDERQKKAAGSAAGLTDAEGRLAGALAGVGGHASGAAAGLQAVGASAEGQTSALDRLIEALKALGLEYDRVKEKGEAAFDTTGWGLPSTAGPLGQGGYQAGGVGAWSPLNPTSTPQAAGPAPPPGWNPTVRGR